MNPHLTKVKDPILRQFDGRCPACYMRQEHCLCELVPTINNKTFLTVVMHHRETYKTTNTARLACMALQNSEIILRGLIGQPPKLEHLLSSERQPVFLTLSDQARTLTPEYVSELQKKSAGKSFHLVVPDGNWRQASRMGKREPILKQIPWVKLSPGPLSRYRLRYEHDAAGLSTLEAIARAFTALEQNTDKPTGENTDENTNIESQLLKIFEIMVDRTLATRPGRHEARAPGT